MYRMSGYSPSASRNPCSTVPGLPNMYVIPSASSCSTMAKRPVFAATPEAVLACGADGARVEPPLFEAGLEHLDHLLAGEVRVGRRAPRHERVVDDDRRLVAVVPVVGAARSGRVAQDPLE